jgi:hypothetical protein
LATSAFSRDTLKESEVSSVGKSLQSGAKQEQKRDAKGRFVKGQSGNPSGRPAMPAEIMNMARASAPDAIKMAIQFVNDEDADPRVRLKAAEILLDRGYGKPTQAVDLETKNIPQVVFVGCDSIPD